MIAHRSWFNLVVSLVTVLLLAVAINPGATQGARVIKVGVITQTTGSFATTGKSVINPALMMAAEINAQGGLLVAGRRYRVEVTLADHKTDPTLALSAMEKFVNRDRMKFIITNFDSAVKAQAPLARVAMREKRLFWVMSTWLTDVLKAPDFPYSFNTILLPELMSEILFRGLIKQSPKARRVLEIAQREEFAVQVALSDEREVKKAGMEWLGVEWYAAGTLEFAPIVLRALRQKPDIIVFGHSGADTPAIIKTLRQQGFRGPTGASSGSDVERFVQEAGAVMENYFQVEAVSYPPSPDVEKYREKYVARFGEWHAVAPTNWYQLAVILEAIKRAGTFDDIPAIARAAENMRIEASLVEGKPKIAFGGKQLFGRRSQLQIPMFLTVVRKGKPVTVEVITPTVP